MLFTKATVHFLAYLVPRPYFFFPTSRQERFDCCGGREYALSLADVDILYKRKCDKCLDAGRRKDKSNVKENLPFEKKGISSAIDVVKKTLVNSDRKRARPVLDVYKEKRNMRLGIRRTKKWPSPRGNGSVNNAVNISQLKCSKEDIKMSSPVR